MDSLEKTLENYQKRFKFWGGDAEHNNAVEDPLKTKADFIKEIVALNNRNNVFLWINVGMVITAFVGGIILVIYFIHENQLGNITIVFGATGVSVGGMIYYMTYLWRQKVAMDLAIIMADRLDAKSMLSIINGLLKTITGKGK